MQVDRRTKEVKMVGRLAVLIADGSWVCGLVGRGILV